MSGTAERLTRYPGETTGSDSIEPDWEDRREDLREELALASLADRLLADGIEGIACRYWHDGYVTGFSRGAHEAFADALDWVRQMRKERRGEAQTFAALSALERAFERATDPPMREVGE